MTEAIRRVEDIQRQVDLMPLSFADGKYKNEMVSILLEQAHGIKIRCGLLIECSPGFGEFFNNWRKVKQHVTSSDDAKDHLRWLVRKIREALRSPHGSHNN